MKNSVLILSTLLFLEMTLHGFERIWGKAPLQAVDFFFGEEFFYGRNDTIPPPLPINKFDPEIGWIRDFEKVDSTRETIAVFGDSWAYGLGVRAQEAFPKAMEKMMNNTQVINYGVPGYGIDQMFLLAERTLEESHPKAVIIAFIGPDLHRSCFPFYFGKQKAYFGDGFERQKRKLKSPEVLLSEHRELEQRILDQMTVWGFKSRLARLIGAVSLKIPVDRCVERLNVEILKRAKELHSNIYLVHLGEELPLGFEQEMQREGVPFISLEKQLKAGRESGRYILDESESHPGPKYHEAIADLLLQKVRPYFY